MQPPEANSAHISSRLGGFAFLNSLPPKEEEKRSINALISQSIRKTAIPAGFITSSGNVYAYVNSVATIRFTIDSGDGFAQLHERTVCVFISPEDAGLHSDASLNEYHIAYRMLLEPESKFRNISDPSQLPLGAELKLIKKTEDGIKMIDATFVPQKDLIPVEKWSNADLSGTHTYIGQKVAQLIPTRSAILLRMKSAGKKCGKEENYFNQLEDILRR